MKRLLVMRHAKSSWGDPHQRDADRPLNARGRAAAPLMADAIARRGWRPDFIACSTAARTRETLDRMRPHLDPATPTAFRDGLYLASVDRLLADIADLPEGDATALLIGHNPGVQDLGIALADPAACDPAVVARMDAKFPTAGLAVFAFDVPAWADIAPQTGVLVAFLTPRDLDGGIAA